MSDEPSLRESLQDYRDASRTEDSHALAARRRRLLPRLRADAETLRGAANLRTAIAVLTAAEQAAFGPLPPTDIGLKEALSDRLAAIPADSYRVPVLLVDEGSGQGVVADLIVELSVAPGQGGTFSMGRADEAARTAARRSVTAAAALLRRLGHGAESADLEVAWQVGATGDVVAGPSVGLGLALAIVARALGKPLPADVAVTGELDLDGRTVPVAGIERKAAAAREAGYTRILVPSGGATEGTLETADLTEAVQLLWGVDIPRPASRLRRPLGAAGIVLLCLLLGLLEIPAVLGYALTAAPLPPEALSDRVVLVTWSRDDDTSAAKSPAPLEEQPVAPLDPQAFPDHKSYRAAHPVVLRRLAAAGTAAVAFDVWFRGGDADALDELRRAIEDARSQGTQEVLPARQSGGRWDGPDPQLAAAATATASAHLLSEGPTSLVRSMDLGIRDPEPGAPAWSLAVAATAAAEGVEPRWNGPERIQIGRQTHAAQGGHRLLALPKKPSYRHYSYADVYGGNFEPADFNGSIVLVGGRLGSQDRHRTPSGRWYGVELLAASVDNLVGRHQLQPLSLSSRAVILALTFLVALGVQRRVPSLVLLVVGTALSCLLAHQLSTLGLVWPWTDVALMLACLAVAAPR
ncbi:MAG: CHASE2 domain-containing protein [Myxococcota bacterium]|nr:CHASE2 domain-containing protein [Myxococcota bacterium]